MELYGGVVHSFTNPEADKLGNPSLKYDAKADARSWAKLRGFLDEVFA
jgi:dienelactone hydrolase